MRFWNCFWYLIQISIVAFFVGRLLPKKWFRADKFPWRVWIFEKDGSFYDKLMVHKWQNKVPDMSKILPFMMPAKKIRSDTYVKMPQMIQETCVAEFIHGLNCIAGLYCLKLYPGVGGIIISFLYAFIFNVPYMIIQRYNRPRLIKFSKRLEEHGRYQERFQLKGESKINESVNPELQYGRGSQLLCKSD